MTRLEGRLTKRVKNGLAPADWKEVETESSLSTGNCDFTLTPDDVSIPMFAETKVVVEEENSSSGRTLDPTTLEVRSLPVEPVETHARDFIQAARSGVIEGLSIDVLKNEAATLGGEPAWNVEYIMNSEGYQTKYGSKFFVIKGYKLFDVEFSTEPLKVPEMRPIGEKILQSFQFTNPQAPASNAPELTNSEPEQSDTTNEAPRYLSLMILKMTGEMKMTREMRATTMIRMRMKKTNLNDLDKS